MVVRKTARQSGQSGRPSNFPDDGRVLVLIQLAGGNDGLNTIVPYANDVYRRERPQLALPRSQVTALNHEIGLNNALASLRPIYDAGNFGIVQGTGYPNPDRSHFRSTDIWLTGSSSEEVQSTGWLGRYFDQMCAEGEECATFGPPAIQIGLNSSLALFGRNQKGIALQNPLQFYQLVSRQSSGHDPQTTLESTRPAERELQFLRDTAADAFRFAGEIVKASESRKNLVAYPGNSLAQQLAIVARMIAGGLHTRVYIVSMRGFDTHARQDGTHRNLLSQLAGAIAAFQGDLEKLGQADRTVAFCFSEFGRRVRQNASEGTDHGTAAPLLVFGTPIAGGIHGPHPDLDDLDQGDLRHLIDYRQIYATLLEQWLGGDAYSVLGERFASLPLIDVPTDVGEQPPVPDRFELSQNHPNPFNHETAIEYVLSHSTHATLTILNSLGQRVDLLVDSRQRAGRHRVIWNANRRATGTYFFSLRAGEFEQTRKMNLVK